MKVHLALTGTLGAFPWGTEGRVTGCGRTVHPGRAAWQPDRTTCEGCQASKAWQARANTKRRRKAVQMEALPPAGGLFR